MTYIVTWEMIYEADDIYDAVNQAYGNLAEIVAHPSRGANFVSVRDEVGRTTHIELHTALEEHTRKEQV